MNSNIVLFRRIEPCATCAWRYEYGIVGTLHWVTIDTSREFYTFIESVCVYCGENTRSGDPANAE